MRINCILKEETYSSLVKFYSNVDPITQEVEELFSANNCDMVIMNSSDYANSLINDYSYGNEVETLILDAQCFKTLGLVKFLKRANEFTNAKIILYVNTEDLFLNDYLAKNNLALLVNSNEKFDNTYFENSNSNNEYLLQKLDKKSEKAYKKWKNTYKL